jgi:hypothetical protein
MLGMVTENTLYFRVDDLNRETFKEAQSDNLIDEGPADRAFFAIRLGPPLIRPHACGARSARTGRHALHAAQEPLHRRQLSASFWICRSRDHRRGVVG